MWKAKQIWISHGFCLSCLDYIKTVTKFAIDMTQVISETNGPNKHDPNTNRMHISSLNIYIGGIKNLHPNWMPHWTCMSFEWLCQVLKHKEIALCTNHYHHILEHCYIMIHTREHVKSVLLCSVVVWTAWDLAHNVMFPWSHHTQTIIIWLHCYFSKYHSFCPVE